MTIEEANALVPRLSMLIGKQFLVASEIEGGLRRLAELGHRVAPGSGGEVSGALEARVDDPDDVREIKAELVERIAAYEEGWRAVQELGAVVKDPRVGLLDFYGRVEGKL